MKVIDSLNDNIEDYIYYLDADTNINKYFDENIFLGDLVGAEHFDNQTRMKYIKDYDRNNLSKAYIPYDTLLNQIYFHAAFFGGKLSNIKKLCKIIIENQNYDKINLNYEPIWNDESYINNYFHYNSPTKIVYYKDFPFIISDKDGMEDQRLFIRNENNIETFICNYTDKWYDLNSFIYYIIIFLIISFIIYYFI